MRNLVCPMLLALSACSAPGGPYPSLQPRAAEAIDPRVPVLKPLNDRPVTGSLAAHLAALVDSARSGNAAFDALASEAERLAAAAGTSRGEGWISAQEALTAAIAARKPTVEALGDIDEIAATALQTQRGIAPKDLAAIKEAADMVGSLDKRQADRVRAVQRQLGL
jgi:hypothetical protein